METNHVFEMSARLAAAHSHGWTRDASTVAETVGACLATCQAAFAAGDLVAARAAFSAAQAANNAEHGSAETSFGSYLGLEPGLSHTTGSGRLSWCADAACVRIDVRRPQQGVVISLRVSAGVVEISQWDAPLGRHVATAFNAVAAALALPYSASAEMWAIEAPVSAEVFASMVRQ